MGRQARLAAQRYRWDTVTQRTIALYESLQRTYCTYGRAVGAN
jgi:hypothetical protein